MKKPVSKKQLVVFSIATIRSWSPCYDPNRFLPETWEGTVVDMLRHKEVPPQDKLWAVCREDLLSPQLLRKFAVAQAKTCRKRVGDKKEFDRILRVCLRFANGKATQVELDAARSAAESARSAAESAWSAAESAAWSAAVKMLLSMILKEYITRRVKKTAATKQVAA